MAIEVPLDLTNRSDESATPLTRVRGMSLEVGAAVITAVETDLPSVPGEKTGKGSLTFTIANPEFEAAEVADAVLTIGEASENQAVVPFGTQGEAVDLADVPADLTGSLDVAGAQTEFTSALVSFSENGVLLPADTAALIVQIDLTATDVDSAGENWTGRDYSLTSPDGSSVLGDGVNEAIYPGDQEAATLVFEIPAPVEGSYELTIEKGEAGTPSVSFEVG